MTEPVNTAITIAPSSEAGLAANLNSIETNIYQAARRNLQQSIDEAAAQGQMISLTNLEQEAIVQVEALKLVGGLDLAALLTRGRILARIREQNLLNIHPEHYTTLAQMAAAQGISSTELSNTETLTSIVFPYLEANGISVTETWHNIGKSKFFELVPVMSAIISGHVPARGTTHDAVEALQTQARQALHIDGRRTPTEEEVGQIRAHAVSHLIELGSTIPVMELRRHIRPDGTTDLPTVIIHDGNDYLILQRADEDQIRMWHRLNDAHAAIEQGIADSSNSRTVAQLRRLLGIPAATVAADAATPTAAETIDLTDDINNPVIEEQPPL
jgi:hypothetical protein